MTFCVLIAVQKKRGETEERLDKPRELRIAEQLARVLDAAHMRRLAENRMSTSRARVCRHDHSGDLRNVCPVTWTP